MKRNVTSQMGDEPNGWKERSGGDKLSWVEAILDRSTPELGNLVLTRRYDWVAKCSFVGFNMDLRLPLS